MLEACCNEISKSEKKTKSREAFLRRLHSYWNARNFPRFYTHIGEIYEVDFGENVGSEFSGRHLAICLSETTIHQDRMLVIPLTTKYKSYNLKYVFSTTSYNGKLIEAGAMVNESRLISKIRVFKNSLILDESKTDEVYAIGKVTLTKSVLKHLKEVNL